MNESRFDDISRRLALAGGRSGSRRSVLKAGAGVGLVAAIGTSELCAAAPTIVAPAGRAIARQVSPDQLLIQQIAFDLDYDLDNIFRFVADEIAYESYDGALRGVRGTIWSGAGNSVDQSQLLAALLTEALVDVRYAFGTLAPTDAATLAAAMAAPPTPLDTLRRARGGGERDDLTLPGTPSPNQPSADEAVDRITRLREKLFSDALTALDDDVDVLTRALTSAGVGIRPPVATVAQSEQSQHVWLQVRRGAAWLDLDPAFAGGLAGSTVATLTETMSELPPESFHMITIRLVAEMVDGEQSAEQVVLEFSRRSQDLVGEDLIVSHVEPDFLNAIGASLNEALGGQIAYYPIVMLGAEGFVGDMQLTFGSGGGILSDEVLGGGEGITQGECLAERYEVEITSPGSAPVQVRRMLFDRVPASQREAGALDLAAIPSVTEVDLGNGESGLLEVNQIVSLAAVSSGVDAAYIGRPLRADDALSSFTGAVHGLHAIRQALDVARSGVSDLYLDRPNITAYTTMPIPARDGEALSIRLNADLLHQSYGSRGVAAHSNGIYAGVLAHKAERLALDRRLFGEMFDAGATPLIPQLDASDIATVFAAATAAAIPIVVLTPDDPSGVASLGLDATSQTRIRQLVDLGRVVVVPSKPVQIGSESTSAWWVYDPATGALFDQLLDGRSGATLIASPMGEYITTLRVGLKAAKGYIALGACIAAIARAAASMLAPGTGAREYINDFGNVTGAILACAVAGAAA